MMEEQLLSLLAYVASGRQKVLMLLDLRALPLEGPSNCKSCMNFTPFRYIK
jgi:hypothetical protein